jgi:hypothetical protein
MAVTSIPLSPAVSAGLARVIGVGIAAALILWGALYVAGVFPWFGYAWLSRSSIDVGPGHFIIGEDRAGSTFGFNNFVFFNGQTIVFSYDATIRRGCLWMHVWPLFDRAPGDHASQCVTTSGKGEWTVPVTKTGVYVISVDSSLIKGAGPGWDMDYTAWWGAKW